MNRFYLQWITIYSFLFTKNQRYNYLQLSMDSEQSVNEERLKSRVHGYKASKADTKWFPIVLFVIFRKKDPHIHIFELINRENPDEHQIR